MATEGNTLIAACRGAQQMVLIGDQCQLPPVIKTRVHPPPLAVSTVIGSQTVSRPPRLSSNCRNRHLGYPL